MFKRVAGVAGMENKAGQLLFNNKMCVFCDKDIKDYVVSEECRRNILRKLFDAGSNTIPPHKLLHNCCDNCAKKCHCNQAGCQSALFLPTGTTPDELLLPRRRDVSASQKDKESTCKESNAGGPERTKSHGYFMPKLLLGIF